MARAAPGTTTTRASSSSKDPGNIRFRTVVDYNGTPSDVSDDTELSFEVIRPSTGRTDTNGRDFCNDVLIFSAA